MAYRFGHAAAAIGVTESALRNWMTRNHVALWADRPAGGWRLFSVDDVAVLSLVAELVSYGAKVDDAVLAVQALIGSLDPDAEHPEHIPQFPRYIYAVRSKFGGWELHSDESFAFELADHRSVIKIAPMVIIGRALIAAEKSRRGRPIDG